MLGRLICWWRGHHSWVYAATPTPWLCQIHCRVCRRPNWNA